MKLLSVARRTSCAKSTHCQTILREGGHAQRLVVHIFRYRILVLRFNHPESGSGSRGGAGPQLLECLFMGILFGVELGQRGQGVTREASVDQLKSVN
ncbi:hypothetical protein HG531_005037 [Fusarium graminearum]|nr:hypothetical protein HG531_005037 [Fusarium graminearum]